MEKYRKRSAAKRQQNHDKIIRTLSAGAHVTFKELANVCDVSVITVRKDVRYLAKTQPIVIVRGGAQIKARGYSEYIRRLQEQTEEKAQIARVAARLTLGDQTLLKTLQPLIRNKHGWNDIPLTVLLQAFFRKSDRTLYSDAGTTTFKIIEELSKAEMPLECSHLKVVTNSPSIAEKLYGTEIGTVLIGGELRGERHSVVGILAENSLDAIDIVADMSFIGATAVDIGRGFTSDDVMEARMKSRMLESGRIRCAVIDHTKIIKPGATFAVFTPFSAKRIDFVISDDKTLDNVSALNDFRGALKNNNICLLTPKILGLAATPKPTRRQKQP